MKPMSYVDRLLRGFSAMQPTKQLLYSQQVIQAAQRLLRQGDWIPRAAHVREKGSVLYVFKGGGEEGGGREDEEGVVAIYPSMINNILLQQLC